MPEKALRLASPAGGVPAEIGAFLGAPTPRAWVDAAEQQVGLLLIDHANCELKAASTALSLLHRYPLETKLVYRMSRLAREELRHFEQVGRLISELGVPRRTLSASRYASGLHAAIRRAEPGRLADTLIVGALIEARSCERFALLGPRLAPPLSGFYAGLLASEARHFRHYLALASDVCGGSGAGLERRIDALRDVENDLITRPDGELRFHSGPPAGRPAD